MVLAAAITGVLLIEPTAVGNGPFAAPIPTQQLEISFDLDRHLLLATSMIKLEAGAEGRINVGELAITSLEIDGRIAEPAPMNGFLHVTAAPHAQLVTIRYQLAIPGPPRTPDNIVGPEAISLTGFWHPMLDSDMLFELTATLPAGFTAFSEAESIFFRPSPAGREVTFRFPQPLPWLHFLAGPYVERRASFGNGQELILAFFPEDKSLLTEYEQAALAFLNRYMQLLGPYPFERLVLVQEPLGAGCSAPTLILLDRSGKRRPALATDAPLAHAIVHSWLGNGVPVDYPAGNWSEALAFYLADHALAEEQGHGAAFRQQALIDYQSYVSPENTASLGDFHQPAELTGKPQSRSEWAIGYAKGGLVFHMLRQQIGDAAFYAALRDFYQRMRLKRAGWSDLQGSFEQAAGLELDDFFAQWLRRPDLPRLRLLQLLTAEKNGQAVVKLTLGQETADAYRLSVPVVIETTAGRVSRTVTMTGQTAEVEIPVAGEPLSVVLDENFDLFRALGREELPPVWSRFLGDANKIIVVENDEETLKFAPLIAALAQQGARLARRAELTDEELDHSSLLFLEAKGPLPRRLFANIDFPETGFTLEVRTNPLAPAHVAVLAAAPSSVEVKAAAGQLSRYGEYSYLRFENGSNIDKQRAKTARGLRAAIQVLPTGIKTADLREFTEIVDDLATKSIVYVGESHTDYGHHRLQLQIIRALHEKGVDLALGMEMFERPYQEVLEAYSAGRLDEPAFLKNSHYFEEWGYDYRLYREIIDFANASNIPIVALTASVMERDRKHALAAGCSGFIGKPIDISAMPMMVEKFVRHGASTPR